MEDRVDVVITGGGISPLVEKKILGIAAAAELAAGTVLQLQKSISVMLPGLRGISQNAPVASRAMSDLARSTAAVGLASKSTSVSVLPQSAAAIRAVGTAAGKTETSLISLGAVLRTLFLLYFAVAAAQRILSLADAFTEMHNKLRVVTKTTDAASNELERLRDIAMGSRTSFDATVTLYQRLALAMGQLGATGADVEKVVATVNKALIVGGSTAQETTAAIRQLSQAFNKGKADGDEFRSMMENAPELMELVAEELGVARHELLGMAEQGLITADVMFRAFTKSEAVAKKFNLTTITLGQSIVNLNTGFTATFGRLQQVTHANENLAKTIDLVAKNTDILTASLVIMLTVVTVTKIQQLTTAMVGLGQAIKLALAGIGPIGWMVIGLTLAGGAAYVLWNRMQDASDAASDLVATLRKLRTEASPFDRLVADLTEQIAVYQKHDGSLRNNMRVMELQHAMMREGHSLTRAQIGNILNLMNAEDQYSQQARVVQDIYDSTVGAAKMLRYELEAVTTAYELGYMGAEMYHRGVAQIQADLIRTQLSLFTIRDASDAVTYAWGAMRLGLSQLGAELPAVFQSMADVVTESLRSMSDGIGELISRWAVFGESLKIIDVFRNVIAQMIQALVSLTAQYIIVGIARQFAGYSVPEISTAPPLGYSSEPPIQYMSSGGYTGDAGVNQIAGVVHGREFVTNARATQRNRATLEHMNATGSMPLPNITINNNSGVALRAEYIGPDEIRLIAEDAVVRKAPGAIAGSVANPNSSVSRSLRQYTTAGRKGA